MEYVQIPLQIAQKAMRVYRPLLPYVRKRLQELRQGSKEVIEEPIKLGSKKKVKK